MAGCFIMLFNGCFYLWANVSNYVLSYFHQFDPSINQDSIFYVYVCLNIVANIGYPIGTYLLVQKNLNPKYIILIGGSIAITGIYCSTLTTNLWVFIVLYGALMGVGTGMNYMVPLLCGYEYFPNRQGLITGIVLGCYGLGSSIFNLLATKIVNPNNEGTTIQSKTDPNLRFFGPEVANRVPIMFRYLCLIWIVLVIISASLISIPPKKIVSEEELEQELLDEEVEAEGEDKDSDEAKQENHYDLTSTFACVHSTRFWQYAFMMTAYNIFCIQFVNQYKTIGNSIPGESNDLILSEAASASGVVQFLSRLIIGALYDKLGFKPIFTFLLTVLIVNSFTCYHVRDVMWLYILCIELNYMTISGIFALFPAPVIKTFGPKYGAQVYTIIFCGEPLASIIDLITFSQLYSVVG